MQVPDEHGCHRPTSIYPTPGYFNDGMGHEYPDSEWGTPKVIETYRAAIRAYQKQYPDARLHRNPETAMPSRSPSCQSVAMYMQSNIDDARAEFMMERAQEFARLVREKGDLLSHPGMGCGPINIVGFRIIREYTKADLLKRFPA
jgi:hypothetical protein